MDPYEVDEIKRELYHNHPDLEEIGGFFVHKEMIAHGEMFPEYGYIGQIPGHGKELWRISIEDEY